MPTPILMPALSPTMEKGKLAKWLKAEGDVVKSGDILAEIETDKATMEVEAVDEGTMGKIVVAEGTDDVPVNELIAVLLEEGEDASAAEGFTAKAPPKASPKKEEASEPPQPVAPASSTLAGEAAAPAAGGEQSAAAPAANGARVFASPLARRIAKQNGFDIAVLKGSGPHGRIVKRDVEQALKDGVPKAPAAAPAALPPGMADDAVVKMFEPGSFEVVPHDGMRKIIAQRLTQSKQTVPHFYLSLDCDLESLLSVRVRLNDAAPKDADGKPAYKVSVNDFIIKAMAMALQRVPDANASWTDGGMLLHKHSDVGVAVAIPGGLLTPVIRKAEAKGLAQISTEMKDYAARARARKLMPEEYQGGSTAISNLGMMGIKNFSAVINPPHATILAVGTGEKRPVVVGNTVEVRTQMSVTLSTDHRAVDGALGAELLGAFKGFIEEPALMLV
ncbi:MAG: pyruvate dehydrogenase complex dihydrolipoamide acetyltransferase [Rhizobiales bacterium]|nr:pyruvate dehydrogenase complex dihydrolipoamide acetyltransferase [Hyphomicrobiales bacterium]